MTGGVCGLVRLGDVEDDGGVGGVGLVFDVGLGGGIGVWVGVGVGVCVWVWVWV